MRKLSLITMASVAALFFSSAAFAEGGMRMKGGHHMMHMMHMMMDTDKDGAVSKQEFQTFRSQNFSGADKNRDKNLSLKEFVALSKIMEEQHKKAMEMAKQEKMKKHFDKLDANGDGKISKAEFDAKGERSFIRMDHNDDGVLNKKDRQRKVRKMHEMHKKDGRH